MNTNTHICQFTFHKSFVGNVSNPPAYDTLSTHSRISVSDPPPEYQSDVDTIETV